MKRKICVITGTRAEYGVMKPLLEVLQKHKHLTLQLVVTGMHLLKDYGETIKLIRNDGFTVNASVAMYVSGSEGSFETARALGKAVSGFAGVLKKLKPDILLLEGDRFEMLAACVASLPFHIPIVHVSGGDVSGGLDDSIRHALTRFSHIHLTNTTGSYQRILRMGEEAWRVKNVGTLSVARPILEKASKRSALASVSNVNVYKPYLLVVQHPLAQENTPVERQISATLQAIKACKMQTLLMYPNNDLGAKIFISEISRLRTLPFIHIIKNVPREDYLGFLKYASILIGNSSSGIVEAPFFGTPVINIGNRQIGRDRAKNVIDVGYSKPQILNAIKKFERAGFRRIKKGNPYRDRNTQNRICDIVAKLALTSKLLNKRLTI